MKPENPFKLSFMCKIVAPFFVAIALTIFFVPFDSHAEEKAECQAKLIERILDVVENDIIPKTEKAVLYGNKVFGAAILKKSDHSLVVAGTNHESLSPLWHGEIYCMKQFWEMHKPFRPDPKECIFFATHEPCPYCMAAITWNGFDNFYYLFSYEDSKKSFNIPYDLQILKDVFKDPPGGYAHENAFWKSYNIKELIKNCPEEKQKELLARIEKISKKYAKMSNDYQKVKDKTIIPFK